MVLQIFDKNILRLREKRFQNYPASVLVKEVQERLLSRLSFFKNTPSCHLFEGEDPALDSRLRGNDMEHRNSMENNRFKNVLTHGMEGNQPNKGNIIQLTRVPPLTQRSFTVCADEELLPFAQHSFDLILSCLEWEFANDLPGTFTQAFYSLKPNGVFMVAFLGGNSLWQFREVFNAVEASENKNFSPRFSPLLSTNVMAELLQRAGFTLPNSDIDHITVYYKSFIEILRNLQQGVASNLTFDRNRKPLSKSFLKNCEELYLKRFATSQGLPLSFEVIYGTGIKMHPLILPAKTSMLSF